MSFKCPRQTLLSLLLSATILTTYNSLQQPTTSKQSQREREREEDREETDERQRGEKNGDETRELTRLKMETPSPMQSLFGTHMTVILLFKRGKSQSQAHQEES